MKFSSWVFVSRASFTCLKFFSGQKPPKKSSRFPKVVLSYNSKKMTELKFVLCPARHSHPEIDGLPSVFQATEDVFNLRYTEDFIQCMNRIHEQEDETFIMKVFVTWLGPAVTQLADLAWSEAFQWVDNWSIEWLHYDRNNDTYREIYSDKD